MEILKPHISNLIKVSEKTAIACYDWIGKGKSFEADQAAVNMMRESFRKLPIDIRIAIGEGERDKAPRLFTGEKLGQPDSQIQIDLAVDPLEGTNICAQNKEGALVVMAITLRNDLFMAPDIYMNKLAYPKELKGKLNLNNSVEENILTISKYLKKDVKNIKIGVLNRKRHEKLISEIRATKAQAILVEDGDLSLALHTMMPGKEIHALIGIGGAPEGVLAAAALKCLGGGFQGQFVFQNEEEKKRALDLGFKDLDRVWNENNLVSNQAVFIASGVTSGSLLKGVEKKESGFNVESLILSQNHTQTIQNFHNT